eukprot:Rmarinus@m.10879
MPTISIYQDSLNEALGENFSESQIDELLFDYGLELDEVTSEKQMQAKETGKVSSDASDRVIYKVDVPANRYDLLCLEGLCTGLRVFREQMAPPVFKSVPPSSGNHEVLSIKASTGTIRPYAVAAVLRGVTFTPDSYKSFIDLQDKLHQNLCRRRTLVAIGTHDLDTIQGPFSYEARSPTDIKFKPLNQTEERTAAEWMEAYKSDMHLKKYLHIIQDSPVYPVIYDANGIVLSMPPIINGEHSKITLNTKNVFIECTATDETKARIVLNTVVAMFSQHCEHPFEYEEVEVRYEEGKPEKPGSSYTEMLPDMKQHTFEVAVEFINRTVGAQVPVEDMVKYLNRMMLVTTRVDESTLRVIAPPTRSDILHACDIAEDVAISYGYNTIPERLPETVTRGRQFPINKFTEQVRHELAHCGYTEVLTFALCSRAENFDMLRREDDGSAVVLANPKTTDFQICRTALLGGLLKTLQHNKKSPRPIRLFEASDVAIVDAQAHSGARNERKLAAVYSNVTPGFEVMHGLVDRIMELVAIPRDQYTIQEASHPTYFPGRCADVLVRGKKVGEFGVLHPDVVTSFDIGYPTSGMELSLEAFL